MILAHHNHHNTPSSRQQRQEQQQQQQTVLMQKAQSIDSVMMQDDHQQQTSSSTLPEIVLPLYFTANNNPSLLMNGNNDSGLGTPPLSRPLSFPTSSSFHHQHQRAASSSYPAAAFHRSCTTTAFPPFYNPALRTPTSSFQHAFLPMPSLPVPDENNTGHLSYEPHRIVSSTAAGPLLSSTPTQINNYKPLRFQATLQAATAITQKSEESTITYLNRGQLYAIQLSDKHRYDGPIISTIAIMFHDPSHRRVAANYWKFWQSQQKVPEAARAVVIDSAQSTGITQIQCPSFDRITFEWNGLCGARIHVKFNCLSTDFSRIKGVKGIPLRINIESTPGYGSASPGNTAGSPMSVSVSASASSQPDYISDSQEHRTESSYCKIKLFRDKGAERKNKDDAKQASKQFEKVKETAGDDLSRHPMWLMYNQPMPYSIFSETPLSPVLEATVSVPPPMAGFALDSAGLFSSLSHNPAVKHHTRTMTAPSTFADYHQHAVEASAAATATVAGGTIASGSTTSADVWLPPSPAVMGNTTVVRWAAEQPMSDDGNNGYFTARSPNYSTPGSMSSASSNMQHSNDEFARQLMATPALSMVSTPSPVVLSTAPVVAGTKRSFPGSPTLTKRRQVEMYSLHVLVATQRGSNAESKYIQLERLSVDELKYKLCQVLSLHPSQVADVIWRRNDPNTDKTHDNSNATSTNNNTPSSKRSGHNDFLILIDDAFVAHHLVDYSTVTAAWEIKADGMVRLILEQ